MGTKPGGTAELVRQGSQRETAGGGRVPWLVLTVAALVATFLAAPWPLAHKAHAVLHGLCAQRPSHTFSLGNDLLPFDARMTGIYGGFAVATVYLVVRGRFRAFRLPPLRVMIVLGLFVAAMAVDGSNALLDDLGSPVYPPDNRLRLVTGSLAGVALAVALCYLLATTLWRSGDWKSSPVRGGREAAGLALLTAPFGAVVLSGWGWLYAPVALLLLGSAVAAVSMLTTATILLAAGRDRRFQGVADAQPIAAVGLLVGVAFVLLVAAGRFWLEREFGLRTLT